jgi:hypothetical protein
MSPPLAKCGRVEFPPLSRHRQVDLPAGALRTDEPRTPFEDGHLRAVTPGLFSRIGLEPMLAGLHHTMSRTRAAAALPSVIGVRD